MKSPFHSIARRSKLTEVNSVVQSTGREKEPENTFGGSVFEKVQMTDGGNVPFPRMKEAAQKQNYDKCM